MIALKGFPRDVDCSNDVRGAFKMYEMSSIDYVPSYRNRMGAAFVKFRYPKDAESFLSVCPDGKMYFRRANSDQVYSVTVSEKKRRRRGGAGRLKRNNIEEDPNVIAWIESFLDSVDSNSKPLLPLLKMEREPSCHSERGEEKEKGNPIWSDLFRVDLRNDGCVVPENT